MDKQVVINQVRESFKVVAYPGDDKLVYDNSATHLECAEIKSAFCGKSWQEVTLAVLLAQNVAVSFFTPQAFQYYLPAYLIAVVEYYEDTDVLPDVVVSVLTLPDEGDVIEKIEYFQSNPELAGSDELRQVITDTLQKQKTTTGSHVHEFYQRLSGFSAEQGHAVKLFLTYLIDEHADDFFSGPQDALDRYWFAF